MPAKTLHRKSIAGMARSYGLRAHGLAQSRVA